MKRFWHELRYSIWGIIGLGIYLPLTSILMIPTCIVTALTTKDCDRYDYITFRILKALYLDGYYDFVGRKIFKLDLEDLYEELYDYLVKTFLD